MTFPSSATVAVLLSVTAGACAPEGSAAPGGGREPGGQGASALPLAIDAELSAELDAYLAPLVDRHLFSGIVLVGDRDSVLAIETRGAADDGGTPIGPDTRFVVASVTKGLTAAGILLLREAGALTLDDALERFEPGFPRGDEITVRHLLLHRSGVDNPDYLDPFNFTVDLDGLVERIAARPFLFDPGTDGRYSNAGYALLARVIERAGGSSYPEYLRANIFEPLGMTRSGDIAAEPDPDGLATGYYPAPGPDWRRTPPPSDPGFLTGSGSVFSTASDMWRWARAVGDDWPAAWLELEWPYGWGKLEVAGHEGVEQTGAVTGYMSVVISLPTANRFVVVLMNQEYGRWTRIGRDVASMSMGEPVETFEFPETIDLPPSRLARFEGSYEAGETTFRIQARDGVLWQYWREWPVPKYLLPVGETAFTIPSDNGTIRFEDPAGSGEFTRFVWDFGGGDASTFERTDG